MKLPGTPLLLVSLSTALAACSSSPADPTATPGSGGGVVASPHGASEAGRFLEAYTQRFLELYRASSEAEWASNTHIVEGDSTNLERTKQANEALAAFTGSVENIETARRLLAASSGLQPKERLELEQVLFRAAGNPQTVPEIVKERIAAEAAQTEALYGYHYSIDGESVSTNAIDDILRKEPDLVRRRAAWEASKDVGRGLRPGLVNLRRLRNSAVQALGYHDFFSYMASEYGWTADQLIAVVDGINRELRPLFRELHTWARYELAAQYGQPVPDLIPAHWLPNRWGQDWTALVEVEGLNADAELAKKGPEWLVKQAERFYVSLGFEPLPPVFWERSSLYPAPAGAGYQKNNHASAWHMDLQRDVRSLMSVEPNMDWYETTHHELGHIYYYLSYTNPSVPPLLREGANRAYHEAVGSLMGLAAMQPRFLQKVGLASQSTSVDPMQTLLKEALMYVVFIPWSTGTMSHFEKELYADELPPERWNARWWELAATYQGIAPPSARDERYCDPATKTHINDDPAGYYDYALSFVLLFQLHDHIARAILHEDPRDTLYYGRREIGDFLRSILEPGASVDWKELLRERTGSELTAKPMLAYFEPLMGWLQKENQGRKATLAEL